MKISLQEFRDVVRSVLAEADPATGAPAAAGAPAPGAPPAPAAGGAPPAGAPPAAAPQATPVIDNLKAVMTSLQADTAAVKTAAQSAKDPTTHQALSKINNDIFNVDAALRALLQKAPK